MASVLSSEDLTCSVCLSIFTDPVTVPCGHSFCRQCATAVHSCPQCREAFSTEAKCLPTNVILKSLAEKAREAEKTKEEGGSEKAEVDDLCPEHKEKLKLFCVTEQQLVCIICRDGERHEGHKFKPIKEAAASLRKNLETFLQQVFGDINAIESLAKTQREEITKTKQKSEQLMNQIRRQFEEMHQFLWRREDEIKNELKHKEEDGVEKMSHSLNDMETALSERRELEVKATSVVKISDSEKFLKSWTEGNNMRIIGSFRPRANELQVVNSSLSLEPYESHLQFFMWKEMLQVIQPRAERLSLTNNSTALTVSDDGRSLFSDPKSKQAVSFSFGNPFPSPMSGHNTTTSGLYFGPSSLRHSQAPAVAKNVNSRGLGSLKKKSTALSMSDERRSLFSAPQRYEDVSGPNYSQQWSGYSSEYYTDSSTYPQQRVSSSSSSGSNYACSVTEFTSGQHYWEVEVRSRDYWELGLKDNGLRYDGKKYYTFGQNASTELAFEGRPRKIGVYLNCSSKKLSFYDADNMTHIHTVSPRLTSMPLSAYFNIRHKEPDHMPITVCWY